MDLWRLFIGHRAVGFKRGESSREGTIFSNVVEKNSQPPPYDD